MTSASAFGPGQRRRICIAVLAAVVLAVALVAVTADGPNAISGGLGGDYPSFHAAGDIARDRLSLDATEFYDPGLQAEVQQPYLDDADDGQLYFGYPAFFVVPYVAISSVGFTAGYLLHTVLMAAALAAAIWLLRPCNRIARDHPLELFTASITFFPLFRGVTGGQNIGLTVLLVAVVWRCLEDDRDLAAGVAVGLLLFKPPFALPFLGVLFVARRWRALGGAAATAVALYAVASAVTDPTWMSAWIDAVQFLDEFDTPFNVQNFVSIPGFAEAVFGIDSTAALVVGYGLAAPIAAVVALTWLRARSVREAELPVGLLVVSTAVAGVLVSPHALYYDAGVLVLVGMVLLERRPRYGWVVAAGWVGGLLHFAASTLDADPLVALVVVAGLMMIREAWTATSSAAAAQPVKMPR